MTNHASLFTRPRKRNETRLMFWCQMDGDNTMICKRNVNDRTRYYMALVPKHCNPDVVTFSTIANSKNGVYTDRRREVYGWMIQLVQLYLEGQYDDGLNNPLLRSHCEFLDKEIY